jgi:peptidyl-prolyl cis-trans isomerase A (cyclophilin A)
MRIILPLLAILALAGCKDASSADTKASQNKQPTATSAKPVGQPEGKAQDTTMANPSSGIPQGKGDLYAVFQTSQGNITVRLLEKDAPETVANFTGLATGAKEWTDPRTRAKSHAKLYDGTVFHRVIPNFMIQGGDPLGTGTGDPGYKFKDEFQSGRSFDKPGLLAMANAGPNTNGSQFFITEVPTPHLNNRHTIFGEVVKGFELVPKIARAGNGQVALQHVEIVRSEKAP